ncbi:MAG: thiamine pyrophosphate-dependent enzyme [Saprospiraceae bacterium]
MTDNVVIKRDQAKLSKAFIKEAIEDYRTCCISRETSLLGRKEVLTGKAKFGILGDGKEVPQVAMARAFKKGDWRSGYYRDQTFMFALGLSTVEDFFAQLYADAVNDPFSGGRQMNSHYASPSVDQNGEWTEHTNIHNISSDISSTGGQMARGLGLALASKKYRESEALQDSTGFSNLGNEVCFCTIGDASTSEGVFWETINAACVMQVPMGISVWDDGYGISVPAKYQTTKQSISEILSGFKLNEKGEGMDIHVINGWDYVGLREMYTTGIEKIRTTHIPALFHVKELTQPQGHSTSGSHERYKSKERLNWEKEKDCILVMKHWMIESEIATASELEEIEKEAKTYVRACKARAWEAFSNPVKEQIHLVIGILSSINFADPNLATQFIKELNSLINPTLGETLQIARRAQFQAIELTGAGKEALSSWIAEMKDLGHERYDTRLYSESSKSALRIPVVPAEFSEDAPMKNGYEILNKLFDAKLSSDPSFFAFGEDVGYIGDVNQGFAGLQEKYGEKRVFDTGIREWTIMGQAIGMAMRGLRPIAEIQYLDYLIYGLEPLTDDLATLRYRSNGLQQAPAIIRTRGHRLEGIWHSGSQLGMLIHALRGMYICVPRNMTQAAGFYNTLLQSDDPALVIECLNGYRLKEKFPDNLTSFTVPLGVPEVLSEGTDVTLVTYGSCVRVAEEGVALLAQQGISVELIDVQTLLPFDLEMGIVASLKKTNRVVFLDEDVPGGASSYMMQQVLEVQDGYRYLDTEPKTITAPAHRPPFGSDGDYFCKPNPEDIFEVIYNMMHEALPQRFPQL